MRSEWSARLPRLSALVVAVAFIGSIVTAGGCSSTTQTAPTAPGFSSASSVGSDAILAQAFAERAEDLLVKGEGTVERLLADDEEGDRHQRFIVRLDSGQTLLIAHNIDVAPRVPSLEIGDTVGFQGEYVWNEQGGLIHWTHHDPVGDHVSGWIEHEGVTYR